MNGPFSSTWTWIVAGSSSVAVTTVREKIPRSSSRFSMAISLRGSRGSPGFRSTCRLTSDSRVRCRPVTSTPPTVDGSPSVMWKTTSRFEPDGTSSGRSRTCA